MRMVSLNKIRNSVLLHPIDVIIINMNHNVL